MFLDGSLLYLTRFVQIGVYFGAAYLFRDHLPSVRILTKATVGAFVAYLAISAALSFAGADETSEGASISFIAAFANVCSGAANAGVWLVLAHLFSTYGPKTSAPAIVVGFLGCEVLYGLGALVPGEVMGGVQIGLRCLGLAFFVAAVLCKNARSLSASEHEHPLQYAAVEGMPASTRRPIAFLVNGTDWVFQVVVAILVPLVYGAASELLSTGQLSDGLHDIVSEAGAVVLMTMLLVWSVRRGDRLGFTDLFVPVVLLDATGLLLLPVLWEVSSPVTGVLLRCAMAAYQPLLWALLARKAFEDPRHTYLYFGVFLGFANVSYARLFTPLLLGDRVVDMAVVTGVALTFLWLFVLLCLLLFVLQRVILRHGDDGADGTCAAGVAGTGESAFSRSLTELFDRSGLTNREREVAMELLHGYSMANVAKNLGISDGTVRTHMRSIYQKTGRRTSRVSSAWWMTCLDTKLKRKCDRDTPLTGFWILKDPQRDIRR